MPAIALVAAGTRLGLSLGRIFGAHGYRVALLARSADRLDHLVAQLAADDVDAHAFPADVLEPDALADQLQRAAAQSGGIDVLQYSAPYVPLGDAGMTTALDVSIESLRPQVEATCYGAIAATRAVLPAMTAAGSGTLLYTTGASAVAPAAWAATAGFAGAGLRNWALTLNGVLAERGVYVGYLALGAWLAGTPGMPADVSPMDPDSVAEVLWDMHSTRRDAERLVTA